MVITDIRFAFIEVETLADPLAAVKAPAIPLAFLLNEAAYQSALDDALKWKGARRLPWYDDAGKLFWYFYLARTRDFHVTFNEAWRGLVPLMEPAVGDVTAEWLGDGEVVVSGYFYPWGVAAIVEVGVRGRWSLDKAVELGLEVRASGKYDFTAGGKTTSLSMNGLMSHVLGVLRDRAYGAAMPPGKGGELCSVVTVLDAEKAADDTPVADQSQLHRVLDAFVSWSPLWKKVALDKIADRSFRLKPAMAAPGHVLYRGRRGRAVWFPAGFPKSSTKPKGSPICYHQNLCASMLQTESLCALARSAADLLAAGQTMGAQSVTYFDCAQLAAGILGRLHGGNHGTYKSRSVRSQIQDDYLAEVNEVRKAFPKLKDSLLEFKPVNT